MNRYYKYRIYPTKEQETLILKTCGCSRFIYNKLLSDYEQQRMQKIENPKMLTPAKFKHEFPWLKEVDSLSLCNAQLNLQTAYKKFWKEYFPQACKQKDINKKYKKCAVKQFNKNPEYEFKITDIKGYPNFHSKRNSKQKYTTNNINNSIRIEHGLLKLPKLGYIKVNFHRYCKGQIKSVTISIECGKYYISILTHQEDKIIQPQTKQNVLGIDMSLQCFAAYSNGTKTKYPKYYRKSEKRLKRLNRSRSRKVIGSKNYEKHNKRIAVLHKHIVNQRLNFLYNEVKRIIQQYNIVVVEDIDLRNMANKKCHHGKSIGDNGFGMFRSILDYKLKEMGGQLIKADKFFPSSQLCNKCGYQNKQIKNLSIRHWTCPNCEVEHDRDVNAAINLKNYYTTATVEFQDCGEIVRPTMLANFKEAVKIVKQDLTSYVL